MPDRYRGAVYPGALGGLPGGQAARWAGGPFGQDGIGGGHRGRPPGGWYGQRGVAWVGGAVSPGSLRWMPGRLVRQFPGHDLLGSGLGEAAWRREITRDGRLAVCRPGAVQDHRGDGREQRRAGRDQGDLPARHPAGDDGVDGDRNGHPVHWIVDVPGRQRRVLVPARRPRRLARGERGWRGCGERQQGAGQPGQGGGETAKMRMGS